MTQIVFERFALKEYAFSPPGTKMEDAKAAAAPVCEGCVFKRAGVCSPALMSYAAWSLGEREGGVQNGGPVLFNNTYSVELDDIKAYEPLPNDCLLSPSSGTKY